ncbi:tyrosinase family protein [Lacunimicrobium album]
MMLQLRLWITFIGLLVAVAPTCVVARDVTIRIVGQGANARYIEEASGVTQQLPVKVAIGDKITWKNEGNRTHTATAETSNSEMLFDTDNIDPGDSSAPVEMTKEIFTKAGGKPGLPKEIRYICSIHDPPMFSTIILSELAEESRQSQRRSREDREKAEETSVRVRRDITKLSDAELTAYRDAWRSLQASGEYSSIAGYHGCPDYFCHDPREHNIFLPWHREYLLRLEAALGEPLHYWDWTSEQSQTSGIPHAFLDRTYIAGDGTTQANPLLAFRFRCPSSGPSQTTTRSTDPPSQLGQRAREVNTAYRSRSYSSVNAAIESPPHNSLHGWVGGQMAATTYAAYDPVFWAHHSNVDRQWASWQIAGGADPTPTELRLPLRGFAGKTVNDVKTISSLGYAYDRYDRMPTREPDQEFQLALGDGELEGMTNGVGKTFQISKENFEAAADGSGSGPLSLYVTGLPAHPADSFYVYVFVNQPDATPADATPENASFAGTFAVFGGLHGGGQPAAVHEPAGPQRVMELFGNQSGRLRMSISTVTLVVTDSTKTIVAHEDIPFDGVRLEREAAAATESEATDTPDSGKLFVGTSNRESYDEAYQNAVNDAQEKLGGGADRLVHIKVVSVTGERGGITGRRSLTVTIRAWLK